MYYSTSCVTVPGSEHHMVDRNWKLTILEHFVGSCGGSHLVGQLLDFG